MIEQVARAIDLEAATSANPNLRAVAIGKARKALEATARAIENRYGNLHPGALVIVAALKDSP